MRVTIINDQFPPQKGATGRYVKALAGLIIQHFPDSHVSIFSSGEEGQSLTGRQTTLRKFSTFTKNTSRIWLRVLDMLWFTIKVTAVLLLENSPNLVIVTTSPPFMGLSAFFLKKLKKTPYIFWTMDLYPEIAISLGVTTEKSAVSFLMKKIRSQIVKEAVSVAAISDQMRETLVQKHGSSKVKTIYLSFLEQIQLEPSFDSWNLKEDWNLEGDFVVLYAGNFGRVHEFDTLLNAAKILKDEKKIKFLLVGYGPREEEIKKKVKKENLKNVIIKPFQPEHRLAATLNNANVHIITLRKGVAKEVFPSKLFNILKCQGELIFIGPKKSEIFKWMERSNVGSAFVNEEAISLADKVKSLFREELPKPKKLVDIEFLDAGLQKKRWVDLISEAT